MTATIYIKRKTEESELTVVPLSAIKEINGESSVWVYNPNNQQINGRKVEIVEIKRNGDVTIANGLKAGEIVVSAGVNSLQENQTVKVLDPISSTNKGGLL